MRSATPGFLVYEGQLNQEQAVNVLLDEFMEQYFLCLFNIELGGKHNSRLLAFYTKKSLNPKKNII